MTAITIVNAIRIFVIVGGGVELLYGLFLIPRFRTLFPQFCMTTGLLSLVAAASANEIDDLGSPFDFALVASVCGIIFTGIGLFMIRR